MKNKTQTQKCAILFSGGKDSCYAAYLAKKSGKQLACLISVLSENKESYMFHTPSILKTKIQAKAMSLPLITQKTKGEKEIELIDLKKAIKKAIKKYKINCIVTGALFSVYQASRIQKICDELKIECFNPLWYKDQIKYLEELIKNKFEIIIIGVAAYPLDKSWLGRKIDKKFIQDVKILQEKYSINPAGEGGEFETFVLNCPLFKKKMNIIKSKEIITGKNSGYLNIQKINSSE